MDLTAPKITTKHTVNTGLSVWSLEYFIHGMTNIAGLRY